MEVLPDGDGTAANSPGNGRTVAIVTRDPELGGGVPSMASFVYGVAAEGGFEPVLICNRLTEKTLSFSDVLRRRGSFDTEVVDGRTVRYVPQIGTGLTVDERLSVFNQYIWEEALADADIRFGVCGPGLCSHPLARSGERYGCWTATTVGEDLTGRRPERASLDWYRSRFEQLLLERAEQRIYRSASQLLTLSHYSADNICSTYGLSREKVGIFPYPVDTEEFTPEGERIPTDANVVLFVGRFSDPRKNIQLLIDAFDRVDAASGDVHLKLVGDSPTDQLRTLVEERGLTGVVEFVEYIPNEELPRHYRSADVFAIPSRQEGLGIVGLEAMASGLPIVSTRCGGPEDYVREGETGYLVDVDDAGGFADRMQELLDAPATRERLGHEARRRAVEQYSRARLREELLSVLDSLGR
jgi:glycosyltransferase involved in cell wall biosynthesis